MAIWKLTNYHKKNAVEKQFWVKDGITVIKEEGFRWGVWTCESEDRPDIDLDNPDGYELMSTDYDWEMEDMDDGCWVEWAFPDDMPEEEQERLQEFLDENGSYALEDEEGWSLSDTEVWVWGPLVVTDDEGNERIIIADAEGNMIDFKEE